MIKLATPKRKTPKEWLQHELWKRYFHWFNAKHATRQVFRNVGETIDGWTILRRVVLPCSQDLDLIANYRVTHWAMGPEWTLDGKIGVSDNEDLATSMATEAVERKLPLAPESFFKPFGLDSSCSGKPEEVADVRSDLIQQLTKRHF